MHIPDGATTTTAVVTVALAQLPMTVPIGGVTGGMSRGSSRSLDYTFPAFEQPPRAESRTTALPSRTNVEKTSEAPATASKGEVGLKNAGGIPAKLLVERGAEGGGGGTATAMEEGGEAVVQLAEAINSGLKTAAAKHGFETAIRSSVSTQTLVESVPTITPSSTHWGEASPALPEFPLWALGMLAGLLSFGLVAAIILFLANFPGCLNFLHRPRRQRVVVQPGGYQPLHHRNDDEYEMHDRRAAGVATSTSPTGAARKRKARHLFVDTSAQYRGLGIAVPGSADLPTSASSPIMSRRCSCDEESLAPPGLANPRHRSAAPSALWNAVTAPLPSFSAFSPRPYLDPRGWSSDFETGTYRPSPLARNHSEDDFSTSSELYDTAVELEEVQQQEDGNWANRLAGRMEAAAQRVARMMYEQVREGGEEGLLLSFRRREGVRLR